MKKILYLIILLIPFMVKAEDITYEVCKSDCAYDNLDTVYTEMKTLNPDEIHNIIVVIKDDETYNFTITNTYKGIFPSQTEALKSTLTIKGPSNEKRPTIATRGYLYINEIKNINIENIDFNCEESLHFEQYFGYGSEIESFLNINNSNINASWFEIDSSNLNMDNTIINTNRLSISHNYISGKHLITNSKMKVYNPAEETSITFAHNTEIKKSEVDSNAEIYCGFLKMEDVKIIGNISGSETQNYKNVQIDGSVYLSSIPFIFDTVEITKGIKVEQHYCLDSSYFHDSEPMDSLIKDSKISNADDYSVSFNIREDYKLKIENTDLSDSACSIYTTRPPVVFCPSANKQNGKILPKLLATKDDLNINIDVSNSKVNCAWTTSDTFDLNGMNMYFDYTNTWTESPVRISDTFSDEFNPIGKVIEQYNGKIFIEKNISDTLRLNIDLDKEIINYFKDSIPEGEVLGDWLIEDETILKIVDGKIVPLKVGTTKIYGSTGNNIFVANITITDDAEVNPNTTAGITRLVILTLIMGVIALALYIKRPKIRIE